MPSSIQIEVVIQDGLFGTEVGMIDIEVPGQHVKTLTCACQLVQQHSFSKLEKDTKNKRDDSDNESDSEKTEEQK